MKTEEKDWCEISIDTKRIFVSGRWGFVLCKEIDLWNIVVYHSLMAGGLFLHKNHDRKEGKKEKKKKYPYIISNILWEYSYFTALADQC